MVKTKQNRWKSKYVDKRNWKIYHEELIRQGEFFFDLQFLEEWNKELEETVAQLQRRVGIPVQQAIEELSQSEKKKYLGLAEKVSGFS